MYVDGVLEKERKMGGNPQSMRGCFASAEDQAVLSLSPAVSTNTNRPHSLFCRPDSKVDEGWVGKIGPSGGLIHQSTDSDLGKN